MTWILRTLWLIPATPLLAAAVIAFLSRKARRFAASLAIGSMGISLLLSTCAFAQVLGRNGQGAAGREVFNFPWFQFGSEWLKLGWVLDPLTAVMLLMVTLVGLLIFIYSVGYMAHDENLTRFFCFLSLFAGAMLTVVIANSLLLLFMGWELVGLTSYLLIGFWYHKPSAAAAAKKAFITTRIGDLAFLLGMVWLYSQAGTLLFYDGGAGCMEQAALVRLLAQTTSIGMAASTGIALLIFCGAMGKSGQVPLHVWLPDAMEGPTPVSALIHAATMVAAGVFLVARVYPLMSAHLISAQPLGSAYAGTIAALGSTTALKVVTWVGAITAIVGASIAVAQHDIKRILAYSTISQLGYMMIGLGAGGVGVGMFHLITHAGFKALLFLGAGSIIHASHEEQDIRRMGGLQRLMPITFATYAIGMLALCGFPLFFSGFWSKDEVLHAAHGWSVSQVPFYLGLAGVLLTAFYMMRQVCYVFFGNSRRADLSEGIEGSKPVASTRHSSAADIAAGAAPDAAYTAASREVHGAVHESPAVITLPLVILAAATVLLGLIGTPAWPWFQQFLSGERATIHYAGLLENGILPVMLMSSIVVFLGLGIGYWMYGRKPIQKAVEADALERLQPRLFNLLGHGFYVDRLYEVTVIRMNAWCSRLCAWLDIRVWDGAVLAVAHSVLGFSRVSGFLDAHVIDRGFDEGCEGASSGGRLLAKLQSGRSQNYLRWIGAAMVVLVLFLIWGGR